MNIGLLGGTFDPIHRGHVALAKAAQERFDLGKVYFVPANVPPHKQRQPIAAFDHRYAMVALATIEEKTFIASLLEAPALETADAPAKKGKSREEPANFSIITVRRFKETLKKSDRLFFLIGIDAFRDIAQWHEAEGLLRECEFIIASRPGYSLADVANSLPEKIRPRAAVTKPFAKQSATGDLALPGVMLHLLDSVHENISATMIREAVAGKRPLTRFVDPKVAEYIRKIGLYKTR